jgi:hypothetical protein
MSILKEKVFQALGEASLCWDEKPYGIFDSTNANRIGNELLLAIKDELMRVIIDDRVTIDDGYACSQCGQFPTQWEKGHNACRSQMISAITKLCEEEKCTN